MFTEDLFLNPRDLHMDRGRKVLGNSLANIARTLAGNSSHMTATEIEVFRTEIG